MNSHKINNEQIVRKYTPITKCSQKGKIDLLIKIYRKNENLNFPEGGKLTSELENFQINDVVEISGPSGKINYLGNGKFYFLKNNETREFNEIMLIGGGSGITPLYQIIQAILDDPKDQTKISLLYANKKEVSYIIRKIYY